MVSPVTGPFNRSEIVKGPPTSSNFRPDWVWYQRTWYRQRRPYNLPLAFTYSRSQVVDFLSPYQGSDYRHYFSGQANIGSVPLDPSTLYPGVYNRAYGKFKSNAMSESASLGISLAQRKQALDMMGNRLLQLATFAGHLRKRRFWEAAKSLGMSEKPRGLKKGAKSFANNFLEFHFGWSPLVGDIGSAIDVLQGGVPPARIHSMASTTAYLEWNTSTSSNPVYYYKCTDRIWWRIGADISVSNPNLWLANQLGFVNPASVAWDAVPFSFVVGWFVNVDQFLNSFTDFWGLSVTNSYISCLYTRRASERTVQRNWPTSGRNTDFAFANFRYVRSARILGSIPGPSLRIKDPWILSPSRALTAASLLLQKLK